MVRIIMHGCNGRMGQAITRLVKEDPEVSIVAGVDPFDGIVNEYPVYKDIMECDIAADAVIDFASAMAVDKLLDYCTEKKLPVVLCTTGLNENQLAKLEEISKTIPVLKSANMSVGVNLLIKILKANSKVLADAGFDIEIVEKHHKMKKDAPSGTALALADSINESMDNKYEYVFDRSDRLEARRSNEIGISAVRGGTIVGDHDVIFAGEDEVVTFSHTAYSRAIFAKGAIAAAKYIVGKEPGYYNMQDVIG
ncbi:MAG: 4-hydroxy-tetrahydrodipicolinate reductase [Lachnospiraceae bacterium]|nr:4-hydroxy-tetrahydrodipicolinate reductase [Lachnospiraceae bacterium]